MSVKLPSVDAQGGGSQAGGGSPAAGTSEPGARTPTSSFRLVGTLALAGAVAGFFIVLVHQWSEPRIEAHRAKVLTEAVAEVLASPETTTVYWLHDGDFVATPPAGADTTTMDRVWVGRDAEGTPVGVAAVAAEAGFQDVIRLIFGYDPATGAVLGMKVLESKETPGLGDKIEKDSSFVAGFAGPVAPIVGVKSGQGTGAAGEVDMITGATISSKAVIAIINHRVDAVRDPLTRLWAAGVPGGTE